MNIFITSITMNKNAVSIAILTDFGIFFLFIMVTSMIENVTTMRIFFIFKHKNTFSVSYFNVELDFFVYSFVPEASPEIDVSLGTIILFFPNRSSSFPCFVCRTIGCYCDYY